MDRTILVMHEGDCSAYLKYEALENGKSSGCKGMEAEHHIIELDRVDSSWEAMKILPLDKTRVVTCLLSGIH